MGRTYIAASILSELLGIAPVLNSMRGHWVAKWMWTNVESNLVQLCSLCCAIQHKSERRATGLLHEASLRDHGDGGPMLETRSETPKPTWNQNTSPLTLPHRITVTGSSPRCTTPAALHSARQVTAQRRDDLEDLPAKK